jgi:hypothetical protein
MGSLGAEILDSIGGDIDKCYLNVSIQINIAFYFTVLMLLGCI